MSARPVITFVARAFAARWPDLEAIRSVDSVADRVRSGVDVWIVSTFIELREAARDLGFDVACAAAFPPGQPAVAHWDDLRFARRHWRSYVAAVRADRPPVRVAPWQIVQTPLQAGEGAVHIPSWPQPGLVPRDAARAGIASLGYFGRTPSLPGFVREAAFRDALAARGIAFHADEANWRDYSATDVAFALREEPAVRMATKPGAKLVNAWRAGVPAIVGLEPVYAAMCASPLDFLEASNAAATLAALDRLRGEPGLYEAMVAQGRSRAAEFSRDAIRARWIAFLSGPFLEGWQRWSAQGGGHIPLRQLLGQWRETRRFKRQEAREAEALARMKP